MDICLLIVFNHRYDANLPILRQLYSGRYAALRFLVPEYDGVEPDVIAVYGHPYYYQDYIAQAYPFVQEERFTHYLIAADDLLLNPHLDTSTLPLLLQLQEHSGFIKNLGLLTADHTLWDHFGTLESAYDRLENVSAELPSREEAIASAALHGIAAEGARYPLLAAYSDFVLVPAVAMPAFCRICHAMAAIGLFVEVAIPTALALSVPVLQTEDGIDWSGIELWGSDRETFGAQYGHDLSALLSRFPERVTYVHPVKLSQWMPRVQTDKASVISMPGPSEGLSASAASPPAPLPPYEPILARGSVPPFGRGASKEAVVGMGRSGSRRKPIKTKRTSKRSSKRRAKQLTRWPGKRNKNTGRWRSRRLGRRKRRSGTV